MRSGRVAIARAKDVVAEHVSRAEGFAVFDCDDGIAVRGADLPMPALSIGFLLAFLQGHGIGAVIAGNTGGGLCALLEVNGFTVIRGVEGSVEEAARAYAAGTLASADIPCTDHDACTGCGNCG
jgi:predicted Fe-Mo cluster-binding NifX family protein